MSLAPSTRAPGLLPTRAERLAVRVPAGVPRLGLATGVPPLPQAVLEWPAKSDGAAAASTTLLPTYPAPSDAVRRLHRTTRYLPPVQAAEVCAALDFASRAHEGQRRKSGEPYIIHPIEVACILAEHRMDADTIIAGLLHDVVEDTKYTVSDIASQFGSAVSTIVSGVTDDKPQKADNQRELLLAMSAEWRVLWVKLADRLHNMRTLKHMPKPKQVKKARETLELFVPLAQRVGATHFESELNRLSATYLHQIPAAAEPLLDALPGTTTLLDALARLSCPTTLDGYLEEEELTRHGVDRRLLQYRRRWSEHCAQHVSPAPPNGHPASVDKPLRGAPTAAAALALAPLVALPTVANATSLSGIASDQLTHF